MFKTDCNINNLVGGYMLNTYEWIIKVEVNCQENYGVDDIVFYILTKTGEIIKRVAEVKSIKGGFNFKYDGEWNNWFNLDNPNGIAKKMKFGNVPSPSVDILELPYQWEPEALEPTEEPLPEHLKGKKVYMLNATDFKFNVPNGKTYKVYKEDATVIYVAADGLIFFNPTQLRKSFLGYAWYLNKSHTEEINKVNKPKWELKCLFDLEGGAYHKVEIPKDLLDKKKKYN